MKGANILALALFWYGAGAFDKYNTLPDRRNYDFSYLSDFRVNPKHAPTMRLENERYDNLYDDNSFNTRVNVNKRIHATVRPVRKHLPTLPRLAPTSNPTYADHESDLAEIHAYNRQNPFNAVDQDQFQIPDEYIDEYQQPQQQQQAQQMNPFDRVDEIPESNEDSEMDAMSRFNPMNPFNVADSDNEQPESIRKRYNTKDESKFITPEELEKLKFLGYLQDFMVGAHLRLTDGKLSLEEPAMQPVVGALERFQSYANIPITGDMDPHTKTKMNTKRCAMPDISPKRAKRYTLHDTWKNPITWSVLANSSNIENINVIRTDVDRMLKRWKREAPALEFVEVAPGSKSTITLGFYHGDHGDGTRFDGNGWFLAHAFYPGPGRGGQIHIDAEEPWVFSNNAEERKPEESADFQSIALHELGHALGVGHSDVHDAVMYPYYGGVKRELKEDDIAAIKALYGNRNGTHTNPSDKREKESYKEAAAAPVTEPTPVTRPPPTPVTTPPPPPPQRPKTETYKSKLGNPYICDLPKYDSVANMFGEVYVFKGPFVWRMGSFNPKTISVYPINKVYHLPDFEKLDAIYIRKDGKVAMFINDLMYVFSGNDVAQGYPKKLSDMGIEGSKIDTAFRWHNKTFILSGDKYWLFDEKKDRIATKTYLIANYFRNLQTPVDAAMSWLNGKVYFFKDRGFYEFDEYKMSVKNADPYDSSVFWANCPRDHPHICQMQHMYGHLTASDYNTSMNAAMADGAFDYSLLRMIDTVDTFRYTVIPDNATQPERASYKRLSNGQVVVDVVPAGE
ncbi:matrix metalloproteinase [Heliothis zea nudivirus]|uniref:Matrix metalloproteinase n=1 Tax=Heliothis zea nudivirus 1 TaxID=3116536 RepID=Q8JKP2_9VIRU|nr:matrix metalloproteinase [Heliothis zea nudivirus]AAN04364.1 matrix metalloproteinase [Heliothis zea nudivirus]